MAAVQPIDPVEPEEVPECVQEMINLIDAEIERVYERDGHFVAPLLALELVTKLRRENPALLRAYLDARAVGFLTWEMRQLGTVRRQHVRRAAFSVAANDFEKTGDPAALTPFLDLPFVIDNANTRKRLADMTRPDLRYVAARYRHDAKKAALEAKFFEALALKVGEATVGDFYTEDKLTAMYRSFVEKAA